MNPRVSLFMLYQPPPELIPADGSYRMNDHKRAMLLGLWCNLIGEGKRKVVPTWASKAGLRIITGRAHYSVFTSRGFTVVILTLSDDKTASGEILVEQYVGVAKCHPDDSFNFIEGEKTALRRALRSWIAVWDPR